MLYDLAGVRLLMIVGPIGFARHAGSALATLLIIPPGQVRMVFADPSQAEAVGAVRVYAAFACW